MSPGARRDLFERHGPVYRRTTFLRVYLHAVGAVALLAAVLILLAPDASFVERVTLLACGGGIWFLEFRFARVRVVVLDDSISVVNPFRRYRIDRSSITDVQVRRLVIWPAPFRQTLWPSALRVTIGTIGGEIPCDVFIARGEQGRARLERVANGLGHGK
jgi:hypothetical protein